MTEKQNNQEESDMEQGDPTTSQSEAQSEIPFEPQAEAGAAEPSRDEQLHDAEQRALRAQAELENFRKRTYRTMEEERKYASLPFLRDLLSVVDNLNRALLAATAEETESGIVEGVRMVSQQLDSLLDQHQCRKIEAWGLPFDPSLHEAVGQMPHPDIEAGRVCEVTQIGYQLHDRVVRPAQIFVSTGVPETPQADDSEEN